MNSEQTTTDTAQHAHADSAERALRFECEGDHLIGILHPGHEDAHIAVVVIVGGPQYRVGSHRQFVHLARELSRQGVPVLRFDYRGMGDGEGEQRDFERVQSDIRAAIETLLRECPGVREVALWGLCDGASAACFYAPGDPRVTRMILLNPWVTTAEGQARAYIAHYYLSRLLSRGFWRKLLAGEVRIGASVVDFLAKLRRAMRGTQDPQTPRQAPQQPKPMPTATSRVDAQDTAVVGRLPDRMASGLEQFSGRVLYILSGRDLTAQEFRDVSRASKRWRKLMSGSRCAVIEIEDADHTFSSPRHSATATRATLEFVQTP